MVMRDLFGGVALGAGLMYYFDPRLGRRRRVVLRDQTAHALRRFDEALDAAVRDVENRLRGWIRESRSAGRPAEVSDSQLAERIRARLGRVVSHPSAIEVAVVGGQATLGGLVLAEEADGLRDAVHRVPGVHSVVDRLEVHPESDHIVRLQGHRSHGRGAPRERGRWSPTTRLAASALGTAWMVRCATDPTAFNVTFGTLGFGLALRALTNLRSAQLLGLVPSRTVQPREASSVATSPPSTATSTTAAPVG